MYKVAATISNLYLQPLYYINHKECSHLGINRGEGNANIEFEKAKAHEWQGQRGQGCEKLIVFMVATKNKF